MSWGKLINLSWGKMALTCLAGFVYPGGGIREFGKNRTLGRGSVSWGECRSGDGRVIGTKEATAGLGRLLGREGGRGAGDWGQGKAAGGGKLRVMGGG